MCCSFSQLLSNPRVWFVFKEFIITVLLLINVSFVVTSADNECHDAYSCYDLSVYDNDNASTSIQCWGYFSCANATEIQSTSNSDIECYGSYSCYHSQLIQHNDTQESATVQCTLSQGRLAS